MSSNGTTTGSREPGRFSSGFPGEYHRFACETSMTAEGFSPDGDVGGHREDRRAGLFPTSVGHPEFGWNGLVFVGQ